MQRHAGTLPARRYGPRARQSASRTAARGSAFPSATATLKSASPADEESLSSVEHSLDGGAGVHSNLLSPPATEASHSALKHATQTREVAAGVSSAAHQPQHQPQQQALQAEQRNPIAPIAVQFNSRFYSPSPSLSAPLAHTATWLASGTGIASSKGRPYDSFLSSYAGFGQHASQHLTRLTLLPSDHHQQHHHHEDKSREMQMQGEYAHQTSHQQPNPDFSQLLD